MRVLSSFSLLATLLIVSACNSGGTVVDPVVPSPIDRLNGLDPLVSSTNYELFNNGAASASELITYRMQGIDGGIVEATAVVLIPQGAAPEGGFPVVAWGHGTTGVADRCAPSATNNLAGYATYLDMYLQNGYAVVAPDYEGLGVDRPHPYLHLASEGRSMIYAVNAAVQQYPGLSSNYAVVGHSQGGHAALGAGEYAAEVSGITLVGVVAIAPASNLRVQSEKLTAVINDQSRTSADRVQAAIQQLLYSSLVLNGVSAANPEFDSSAVYGNNGTTLFNSLETSCTSGIREQLLSSVTGALFISNNIDSIIPADTIDLPQVAQYISSNEPASQVTNAPVMLLQGLLDETVLAESTSRLNNLLMQINPISPTLTEYPTADHGTIVGISADDVISFLGGLY